MIRRISGTVVDITDGAVVVDVGGVGYLVYTTGGAPLLESQVQYWTHLAVRENALDLYGFSTRDDLELFSLLLGIPKIGPKSAQQIMTQAPSATIKQAVASQDATYLTKMSGVGKKTAEKIVSELKDKLATLHNPGTTTNSNNETGLTGDVIDALVALGYPLSDARTVAQQLPNTVTTVNEAVREALQQLGKT